jgi:hypothetical protein
VGSSRERANWLRVCALQIAASCALCGACSVGHGSGELVGKVAVPGCLVNDHYSLTPTSFFAEAIQQLLSIRVQRGSDLEVVSDGLDVLVHDANQVERKWLGKTLDITKAGVDMTFYLNESCPAGRDKTPIALQAVSGTIRFDDIYAPQVDSSAVEIKAELNDVRFEDSTDGTRSAELSGNFDFLYVRGRPAQRYP